MHLGRLERRRAYSRAAQELHRYLTELPVRIHEGVYRDLVALAARHQRGEIIVEKAVDVMIAVDMVVMAGRDEYDSAYLLSADGDFTPAVQAVRSVGKQVFAVAGRPGAQLRSVCNAFIRIDRAWLQDCYQPAP